MPRSSVLSYQKLKKDPTLYEEEEEEEELRQSVRQIKQQERQPRFRVRKRWRIRVPRLRRIFNRVRKGNLVWASCAKVVRRLKESQAHFGDLFAGNYLFLQVTPDSLKLKPQPNLRYLPPSRA